MTKFFRMEFKGSSQSKTSSNEFQIIPYCSSLHHDKIPFIYAASFKDKPWDTDWDTFSEFDPSGIFLVMNTETKELVGYVISFKRKNFGYISVVAVIPNWQRHGVASALIRTAIQYLHSLNIETLKIDVEEKNIQAKELYKKTGFIIVETFED